MVTRNATASRVINCFSLHFLNRADVSFQYSHLYRGVYPFLYPGKQPDFDKTNWQEDVDQRLKWGIAQAIRLGVLNSGDQVVAVQGWRGGKGHTNSLRIVTGDEDLSLTGA